MKLLILLFSPVLPLVPLS